MRQIVYEKQHVKNVGFGEGDDGWEIVRTDEYCDREPIAQLSTETLADELLAILQGEPSPELQRLRDKIEEMDNSYRSLLKVKNFHESTASRLQHDLNGVIGQINGARMTAEQNGVPTHPATGAHKHDASVLLNDLASAAVGKLYTPHAEDRDRRNRVKALEAENELLLERLAGDELRVKVAARLVERYRDAPVQIAQACDKTVDPTGNLLGWIRDLHLAAPR